jgi:hypothetical protein
MEATIVASSLIASAAVAGSDRASSWDVASYSGARLS